MPTHGCPSAKRVLRTGTGAKRDCLVVHAFVSRSVIVPTPATPVLFPQVLPICMFTAPCTDDGSDAVIVDTTDPCGCRHLALGPFSLYLFLYSESGPRPSDWHYRGLCKHTLCHTHCATHTVPHTLPHTLPHTQSYTHCATHTAPHTHTHITNCELLLVVKKHSSWRNCVGFDNVLTEVVGGACECICGTWLMEVLGGACESVCGTWLMEVLGGACECVCGTWLMEVVGDACECVCVVHAGDTAYCWYEQVATGKAGTDPCYSFLWWHFKQNRIPLCLLNPSVAFWCVENFGTKRT